MGNIDLGRESDYRRRVAGNPAGQMLPGTSIEIIREPIGRGDYRYALFDFDGTLSLLREGWPQVMALMMVEALLATPGCDSEQEARKWADDLIARTTGRQTIYQMIDLSDEIRARGGCPKEPSYYKKAYLDLLKAQIADRLEGLRCGRIPAEDLLVPGSYALLEALRGRGVQMHLASGTDEPDVVGEAELLGLAHYFGERIYGAVEDYTSFSKAMVIDRILSENGVSGTGLVGFGDGYVEIDSIKAAGGTAIGVASDEAGRSGRPDAYKRERLVGVGADVIVPDFSEAGALVDYLFSREPEVMS